MNSRLGLAIAASVALVAGAAVGVAQPSGSAQAAPVPQRPNVVVLETDDQTLAEMEVLPNKYAEYANGDRELYDLGNDPFELQSQHNNPSYDTVKAALAARLHNLIRCAGASCRAKPQLAFTVSRYGCTVTATVRGPSLASVLFLANGRRVATDSRSPFRTTFRSRSRTAVRARAATAFDQLVTLDRTVRGC